MSRASRPDSELFEGGPPLGLQGRLGLIQGKDLNVGRRAALIVLIGWVPLVLLTIVQSLVLRADEAPSLLWDVGTLARYLIAAPLLVIAEAVCARRLSAIVRHFLGSGLIPDRERGRFDAAVASTRRLLDSTAAEITVIALAYFAVAAMVHSVPLDQLPAWHKTGGVGPGYSPAGWWHVLVSLPLLLVLLLGWMWRLALWARLLSAIARLDLRLVASHPDHAAGLGFVGHSIRAFSIVALALATIVAGRSAQIALNGGALPTPHLIFNAGLLTAVVALFTAPLLVFTPTLMHKWRRGVFEYGTLAGRLGVAFEDKWLDRDRPVDKSGLDTPDFSATTDLYQVVANVYELRFIPIDVKSLIVLGSAMLLPFGPVVLLAVPANVIWAGVKGLLF